MHVFLRAADRASGNTHPRTSAAEQQQGRNVSSAFSEHVVTLSRHRVASRRRLAQRARRSPTASALPLCGRSAGTLNDGPGVVHDDLAARHRRRGLKIAGASQARDVDSGRRMPASLDGVELADVEDREPDRHDRRPRGSPASAASPSATSAAPGMRTDRGDDVGDALAGGGAVVGVEVIDLAPRPRRRTA